VSALCPSPCKAGRGWRAAPGEGLRRTASAPHPGPLPALAGRGRD
jgi:hypothetical protein